MTEVHVEPYLNAIQAASQRGPGFVDYGDTYVNESSFHAALRAAGGALAVTEWVLQGQSRTGFALIRPPGHHAAESEAGGFCLLNNIAVATRWAQSRGLSKVMIVDFDVHHGNGTEAIFAQDGQVLYLSTHQWGIYPGTGSLEQIGSGQGEGATINVPLPAGAGDDAFERIGDQIIAPAAERFGPDILLVSAGFDAHWRDPLASLQLSISGYQRIAALLMRLARDHCAGRLAFYLEGGYDPEVLYRGVESVIHSLTGTAPIGDPLGPAPRPEPDIQGLLDKVKAVHSL